MKVALISPYDFAVHGGVQTHVAELGVALNKDGHTVKVLAPCTGNEPVYDLGDVDLVTFGRTVPFLTAGSVARISMSVWYQPKLTSLLEREQFDVVHIHEPLMPMFGLMASYYSPSPTVGTFHAYNEGPGRGYIFWKPLLKRGVVRLNGRTAVSEPAKEFANKYFPGDYTVIPNGVRYDRFLSPTPKPSVYKDDDFNIFFIGRLNEKRKGLKYLLGAYSLLKWEYPNLRLIVGGRGVPDPDSYRLMGERAISDVIFVGPVSHEELPAYYQHADVFCAPNTGQESFGMVIVEAMAASTAVVASDIPGFRSVMSRDREGIFVPPKEEVALANAIRRLIESPGLRAQMGVQGRLAARRYNWSNISREVNDFYESVLRRDPVPPALYRG